MSAVNSAASMWNDAWQVRASEWIVQAGEQMGLVLTGPPELAHVRPWSAVLKVSTTQGLLWFKANGPGARHEARVVSVLHARSPARVNEPMLTDETSGWFLARPAGVPLDAAPTLEDDLSRWEGILGEYARLQSELAVHEEELIAAGAPDLRPETLADTFTQVLDDPDGLSLGEPGGLTRDEYTGLLALRTPFRDWCDELAELGIASTIQHDDLHAGNVFVGSDGYVFIDWADACVSHPFGSLLHPENEIASRWGLAPDAPQLRRLRTAYFTPWAGIHDPATLLRARSLALQITCVVRALAWRRALDGVERSALKEYYARPEPRWLRRLLQPDFLT
ncbi:phosphotransferase [Streptomyces rubiginosohelvolus]|uniref:phosphotransferase n=1 Tax=Streptomyces rubiginosohelvolus TaxID=67362 RepID=UPI0036764727